MEPASRANGPGLRAVVWFQGCTLGCPGCFNPKTHDSSHGLEADTASLAEHLADPRLEIEGFSFSGGEPFQQPEAFLDLLQRLDVSPLTKLAFSGYTLAEIKRMPLGPKILEHLDVLVAGRYVVSRHSGQGLLGSANQQIHLLTRRYSPADFRNIPKMEIILHADGSFTLSGIAPGKFI
jgi:anaerobic ribonucleoside-triphosphate reductase activating protein